MNFISIEYAVFFAVAFVGWWGLSTLKPSFATSGGRLLASWPRIVFLLAMSYGFYAAWDWRYLPLIFGSSTVDFFLARIIANETSPSRRKALLTITVVLNLGFLGFFKYWNFGVENVELLRAWLTGTTPKTSDAMRVLLPPVGISFFTFESMSYVIDVYRGDLPAHRSYLRYLLFVSFFPHLVAGPIVRPRDLLPQLEAVPSLPSRVGAEAMFLIATGLLKKVVFADQLAIHLVDRVFERPENYSAVEVLAGVYGYAVQIYCDFSGYSDIAIGSALLLGVRFPPNFDAPYTSSNLAEFWRRWHISLSSWLRDYLYIPLGGNRGSNLATYRNLMLTMLLGGLWHGASWTFVFWGFLHGLGLAVTRAFERAGGKSAGKSKRFLPKPIGVILTFHYVCLAWIFFRAPTFDIGTRVLKQISTGTTFHPNLPPIVAALLALGIAVHHTPRVIYDQLRAAFTALPAPAQGAMLFLVAVVLHEAASVKAVPFVYFQF
ncbi:MBOAT family O-acyltransferase [Polyangium jinanense]|uniref:MBOAT family protein n=1 Tax=Polyangium jinanense TaxID=2829994 RepID=A0A9X4AQ85_9BACT|nr:MBOAT family protein [Polyangium jinanense]MDC3954525.1 MBOAT family protein [Polyangium jinanense]MDC3980828.1 MBOAT family protein [Polyangium jinanense]